MAQLDADEIVTEAIARVRRRVQRAVLEAAAGGFIAGFGLAYLVFGGPS